MLSFSLLLSIFGYSLALRCNSIYSTKISTSLHAKAISSANMDWPNLGFTYRPTDSFVQCTHKDGAWGPIELVRGEPYIKLHIGATSLHYGQACFEGLKAFQTKDGKVKVFRPQENAARMARSCRRTVMAELPESKFLEAINTVIYDNLAYLPPYGSGGAMYIRPLLFGSGPRIGLQPSDEYTFLALVLPVADYYKGGLTGVHAVVVEDFDRAAPRGVGAAKVAGNYAADLLPNMAAKKAGFPIGLYLDSKTNSFIEEFSTSNFLAIDKKGAYVTPKSDAILASVTNKSLMHLAADVGMDVQHRPIHIEELVSGEFTEVAACGTAVVVTPVNKVSYKDRVTTIGSSNDVGPVIKSLYNTVRAIQNGEVEDKFGWMWEVQSI